MALAKFKTQKSLKEYFRGIIDTIGLCESIKGEYPNYYTDFLELFKRHPEYDNKCQNMIDIKIRKNPRYHQLELYIEKDDCYCIDISYNVCISGKGSNNLKKAMRNCIESQIEEFKQNNTGNCELCNSKIKIEVDHHSDLTPFKKLYCDFMDINKLSIPDEFDELESHSSSFKDKDKDFSNSWFNYHKQNVIFRFLCKKCNLSQKKYKNPKIPDFARK
jgi:hypothetical protein